jgi:DNA-directed RNA polymerase specialized sigma24 family protein
MMPGASPEERPRFPTTAWSLVARAGQEGECQREALGQLLERYLPALHAHLVYRRGFRPEEADDLVQEFITGKIVEKDLIARADQELGKFRTFLLTALDRFVANQVRNQRAKKRSPGEGMLVSMGDRDEAPREGGGPSDVFDVAWARGVITQALEHVHQECEASGRGDLWGVFECRVVGPTLEGAPQPSYRELVRRFGFRSPTQASNALTTAKRMYARALRSVVAEYAADSREIESELEDLRTILARARK